MPRHARLTSAAILLSLLVATTAVAPAAATFPGQNGRLTFMRFGDAGAEIWTANSDLTRQEHLTAAGGDGWFPSWSPDGSRIAFSSSRSDPDPTDGVEIHDVFTMAADGTDVRQVTDGRGYNGKPAWSPDGRWLVFDADRGDYPASQGIYLVRSDGSAAPRRVTKLPRQATWQELARFSPDGKRIVFNEGRILRPKDPGDPEIEVSALFTVRLDGTSLRQVTPWSMRAMDADWSPDGKRLVFANAPFENDYIQQVMVVDANGGNLRALTQGDGLTGDGPDFRYQESFNPAWSPDGSRIIFVRASFTEADGFEMGLMTMRPDGSGQSFVSDARSEEHQPDWGSVPAVP